MPKFFERGTTAAWDDVVLKIPIFPRLDSVPVDRHPMSWLQLKDVLEHCLRTRYISQRKIQIQRLMIHFPGYARVVQQRLDLRRKNEKVFPRVVVQGLDSETVSHQKQAL